LEGRAASIFTLKMEGAWPSATMVSCHITIQHHNPEDHNMFLQVSYQICMSTHILLTLMTLLLLLLLGFKIVLDSKAVNLSSIAITWKTQGIKKI
jgi:hypothetical protein